ncbi:MAG TPA: hypothetical protein VK190_02775 [Pseudoneobacillus sp.]|nr:hypothetical protein [Pseudoneobacillus sp.]
MSNTTNISYEEYLKAIEHLKPVISTIHGSIVSLPGETKVEDIVAALCVVCTNVLASADADSDDFSLDGWYALCMAQVVEKLNQ